MEVLTLLVLLFANVYCQGSLVTSAINGIFKDHFAKNIQKVDIVYFGNKDVDSSDLTRKILDEILLNKPDSISFEVSVTRENSWKNKLNISSLLIFESVQTFREIKDNITWLSNKRFRYHHLAYIPNASVSDFENIKDGFSIDNVNFLMNETQESVDLVTGFMFTKNKCHQNHFDTINRFVRKSMQWENHNFYPKKYEKFYGCNLTFGLESYLKPYEKVVPEIAFIAIAEHFNFKLDYNYLETYEFYEGMLSNKFDLFYSSGTFNGDKVFITSMISTTERMAFTVPAGDSLTALEKLILPFENEVWIAILATFVITLLTIQIINFTPANVQNFVYGKNVRTPTVNVVNTFLTGGQSKTPGRNFARFILMMFIIWSLIIRTCYQSQYFKFLQSDLRKPRIKTFEELAERNFTIMRANMGSNISESNLPFYGKMDWTFCYTAKECFDPLSDPVNKVTSIMSYELILLTINSGTNAYRSASGFPSYSLLDETVTTSFNQLSFRLFCPFFETFNEKIGEMISSGLIQYWFENYINPLRIKRTETKIGPQVLTLDDLSIGFQVCLIPMLLSIVVFLIELAIPLFKSTIGKLVTL